MTEVAIIFILASLVPIFVMACYGVHLGIKNMIELKAIRLASGFGAGVMAPIDPESIASMEAEADKALGDIEQAQFDHLDDTLYQAGPII